MVNRNPEPGKEGRVKITQDNGQVIEGVLDFADGATQAGSAYSKGNVLPDTVCDALGIDRVGSEPKDALLALRKGFRIDITFTPWLEGKTFTIAGGGFAYSATVRSSLVASVFVPHPNTTYTITCEASEKTIATNQYFGVYSVSIEGVHLAFSNNTWGQIAMVADRGMAASIWQVGDEKDMTLSTGETLTLQIYDFDHDDKVGGGRASITFGLKNLMAGTKSMNPTGTNVGSFFGSQLYTWLGGALYDSLPTDVKTLIKPVYKKTSAGAQSSTINTNEMKVFLFSEVECTGSVSRSAPGEGYRYPIFTSDSSRTKKLTNGAGDISGWWERSPRLNLSSEFCTINTYGQAHSGGAQYPFGICFGFCI